MGLHLKNAVLIDGTGKPARRADVLVDDDRISAVGVVEEQDHHVQIDLSGLVLAPGFIDVHTHYDAQVAWDADITPSSSYGVTTVIMGNCGFGVAPTRPVDRQLIVETLATVEDMPTEALESGIQWDFETFPDYLDVIAARPKRLNVAAYIGHTPLRWYVMGADATERSANDREVQAMADLVTEAMNAGAIGFATSVSPSHWGAKGRPVPSRSAAPEEIFRLAEAMGATGRGIVMVAGPGPNFSFEEFSELSRRAGRPVTWAALLAADSRHGGPLDVLEIQSGLGGDVWPQIACRPIVMQLTMRDPLAFAKLSTFEPILSLPRAQRQSLYANADWRDSARPQVTAHWAGRWKNVSIQETQAHVNLIGVDFATLADEAGVDPFDLLLDLSLEEDLDTRFRVVLTNDNEQQLADLLRDKRTLLGLSDAGAHLGQLCDACFAPYLLGYWSRDKGVLALEDAVWRLTGHPAEVFGLDGRGVVRENAYADLVAFDPEEVGVHSLERVADLPGGAERLLARSGGIEHVWVNGCQILEHGQLVPTTYPGSLVHP